MYSCNEQKNIYIEPKDCAIHYGGRIYFFFSLPKQVSELSLLTQLLKVHSIKVCDTTETMFQCFTSYSIQKTSGRFLKKSNLKVENICNPNIEGQSELQLVSCLGKVKKRKSKHFD